MHEIPARADAWFAERFELLRLLGAGAHGQVHAAHDHAAPEGGRLVALKTLRLADSGGVEGAAAAEARDRFANEARVLRQMQHPDIVAVFDAGTYRDQAWLAMEFAPGADLGRYTKASRLLPEPVVLHIAERLALALAHAHSRGVIHRDLKPENVLLHWPTQSLKIADFGLARSEGGEATRTGLVLGSPAYMAPELLGGAVPDARSDFYALGVLLFQLLTGQLPHQGSTMADWLRQAATQTAPDLRSLRPDWPVGPAAALAGTVADLLSPQAARRLANGDQVAQRLSSSRLGWPGGAISR